MTRCLDCGAELNGAQCTACGLTPAAAELVFRRRLLVQTAIFLAGSLLFLRSLGTLLFGVTPYDVPTYVIVVVLLGAIAALASYLPARRAVRTEPLTALRQE